MPRDSNDTGCGLIKRLFRPLYTHGSVVVSNDVISRNDAGSNPDENIGF
jgi:hypothetical protein